MSSWDKVVDEFIQGPRVRRQIRIAFWRGYAAGLLTCLVVWMLNAKI